MTLRWLLAALHLLALGVGLGAVWTRGRALRGPLDGDGLRRAFAADAFWGVAGLLWIATGVVRAFSGFEKGTDYYLQNTFFHAKMGLLALLLVLEVWPMAVLIGWRMQVGRGQASEGAGRARAMARISFVQAVLVVLMVLAATAMARGLGM